MPTPHEKLAVTSVPILPVLAERWSPYVLAPKGVPDELIKALFEAARWAASSYNEQPWRFIVASRTDAAAFDQALGCLLEANQGWAKHAGLLAFTVVSRSFARNGSPNRVAEHDLGLAMGNLCAQATAFGLSVHQMGGVNLSKVRQTYAIPDGFDPVTAFAVGYPGDPSTADAGLAERDRGPRARRPLTETVFGGKWGEASRIVG
ncbi:MAG TPA: nitroreductase family protein [Pirellulaceae bacterium]|nr:nitroreductase family protein [Pirellulaceae bacterium]